MFQSHILWRYKDVAKVDLGHIKKFYEPENEKLFYSSLEEMVIFISEMEGKRLHARK